MSENDMNALLGLLGEVNDLLEGTPEGAAIFAQLRSGEMAVDDAVLKLAKVAKDAGLLDQLGSASEKVNALVPADLTPEKLAEAERPIWMETSTGVPQLNPKYEAAIAERVSIDGDAPELRSGPIPEEGRPAVPVLTTARDPVVIGLMLERASNEVRYEMKKAIATHADVCKRLLEDAEENAKAEGRDVGTALALTQEKLPPAPLGVPGYEAGTLPALRTVQAPDPHVTAVMDENLRRVATFNVLATTQGRISAAPVIEQALREALETENVPLAHGDPPSDGPRMYRYAWVAQAFGPDDLSDNFNPIQVAIDHLTAFCIGRARSEVAGGAHPTVEPGGYVHPEGGWALAVIPYGDLANRKFGWTVQIGPKESA
jgi:hypothetical protein